MIFKIKHYFIFISFILIFVINYSICQYCDFENNCSTKDSRFHILKTDSRFKDKKFLLYEVSYEEGFNLRIDIQVKMTSLVKELGPEWILVLPSWGPIYHWSESEDGEIQSKLPWSSFFDVSIINRFVPVIELEEYLDFKNGKIDTILSLSHFEDTFDEKTAFNERYELSHCNESGSYSQQNKNVSGWFWSYEEAFSALSLICVNIEGTTSTIAKLIKKKFESTNSIMIVSAQVILHSNYGDAAYWMIRRSLRFAKDLINIGNIFRLNHLNSNDIEDQTELNNFNTEQKNISAIGGPYIAVHWRRRDFAKYRNDKIPTIKCAARQIFWEAKLLNLSKVFVSTDAIENEYDELKSLLENSNLKVLRFNDEYLLPGQNAIIDQWICAHSRLFLGTYESTFTYRIEEERQILGFSSSNSYRVLCAECSLMKPCYQESRFTIMH